MRSGIAAVAIVVGGLAGTAACLASIALAPQDRVSVGVQMQR